MVVIIREVEPLFYIDEHRQKSRMGYDVDMDLPNNDSYPRYYSGYTLLESIGQGGMSAIDLAQTTVTDAQYVRFCSHQTHAFSSWRNF